MGIKQKGRKPHAGRFAYNTFFSKFFHQTYSVNETLQKILWQKISGVPKPPFLIMEPSGAPIINKTKHAKDKVNFRCHSICNFRSVFSLVV